MRDPDVERRLDFFTEELTVIELLRELNGSIAYGPLAIENVTVISMTQSDGLGPQNVLVEEGRISDIGDSQPAEGMLRIDGLGKYLSPGLVDMHVHTGQSARQDLLNLANGITSVREMCGFPSMLVARASIDRRQRLAPRLHVAGHIIATAPLDGYATVVGSPEEARDVVEAQIGAGYEFIKVHNLLEPDVYQAICEAASGGDTWVVGHIPHHISVETAIAAGQRTFEHLKGYYHDWDLEMTDEPYAQLTAGSSVWNCPTFVTYRTGLRDHRAEEWLTGEEARHMDLSTRVAWADLAAEGGGQVEAVIYRQSQEIFGNLLEAGCRFLAGTDSGGGLPYLVPGFALHEELRIMERLGMPTDEVLRSATVEAAAALRQSAESGTVEPGKRADLLLMNSDPRRSVSNLKDLAGLCVGGRWLAGDVLDGALGRLKALSQPRLAPPLGAEQVRDRYRELAGDGYPLFELHESWLSEVAAG